jgi:hypothetical protein
VTGRREDSAATCGTEGRRAEFLAQPVDICVVAFSTDATADNDHYELIARCLESIVARTDRRKYRLHIGCNNLSPRAMRLVDGLCARGVARKQVGRAHRDVAGKPIFPKYPLMRSLYETSGAPWIVWFDDDSYVTAPDWLEVLEDTINRHPSVAQLGKRAATPMADPPPGWISAARWYNSALVDEQIELADGTKRIVCDYIVGGFYGISRDAVRRCGVPDERLMHNGGDWTTGLALAHQGFELLNHTYGVAINQAPRRGIHRDRWCPPGEAARWQASCIEEEKALFDGAPAAASPRRRGLRSNWRNAR